MRGDRSPTDAQYTGNITNARTVQGQYIDLLLYSFLMGVIGIFQLEAFCAGFTSPTLCAILAMTVFNQIIPLAMGTFYLYRMYHALI